MGKRSTSEHRVRPPLRIMHLGRMGYRECWALQREMLEQRHDGTIPDTLLLTEHPPVYTLGTSSDPHHLLAGEEDLRNLGAEVVEVDRGGDVTFHGPGQLVGYPIFDLTQHGQDLARYLRMLEETIIRVLRRYDIAGSRTPGYTGVWVGGDKICAIGIKASRWISMHGFALNVNTDLAYFRHIIPCGIFERGVTSMQDLLGSAQDLHAVEAAVARECADVFGLDLSPGVFMDKG